MCREIVMGKQRKCQLIRFILKENLSLLFYIQIMIFEITYNFKPIWEILSIYIQITGNSTKKEMLSWPLQV